jgi:hypothetical protein
MLEGEPRRVQKLALEAVSWAGAVPTVTAHGVADRRQVDADLVRPSGVE